jgi:RHS repeat-associated protein
VYTALSSFLPSNDSTPASKPKAYLNWMLLDNQFNYVSTNGQSGAIPVGNANVLNTLATSIKLKHSGYLYIWVSNETQSWMVFFDNLSIEHFAGPMLEENHYYPFGLTMAGISDKALKTPYAQNKYRYNGKELQNQEFSDGTGLEEYDFGTRFQDPQLGRWWTIDPKTEQMRRFSPYNYAYDNPIRYIDPDGMSPYDWVHYLDEYGQAHMDWIPSVHDQKSAKDWAASAGKDVNGNDKNTDVTYVGKEGYVTNGRTEDGQTDAPYKLNSDGTADRLGDGDPKPSTTKVDLANVEPEQKEGEDEVEKAIEKTVGVMGLVGDIGEKVLDKIGEAVEGAAERAGEEAGDGEIAEQLGGLGKQIGALGDVAKGVGVAATAYETVTSTMKLLHGKGTWKDVGNVVLGAATGISMFTGVGEAVVGGISIGWGIYKIFSD